MAAPSRWPVTSGVIAVLSILTLAAQQRSDPAPAALDSTIRATVIDGAIDHMRRAYIFAEVAEKMAAALKARAANNEYDRITDPKAFAETLTTHLQEVSRDKHLRIIYDPEGLPRRAQPTPGERTAQLAA